MVQSKYLSDSCLILSNVAQLTKDNYCSPTNQPKVYYCSQTTEPKVEKCSPRTRPKLSNVV